VREKETVDLILMDVQMPGHGRSGSDGGRSAKRETAGGYHLPIVALTAHAMSATAIIASPRV